MTARPNLRRTVSVCAVAATLFAFSAPTAATAVGSNLLLNPGFEVPAGTPSPFGMMVSDSDFPGWDTTDVQGEFEVWSHLDNVYPAGEAQYIELNAWSAGAVYQDVDTTPCDVLTWTLDHRARVVGTDTMFVLAGAADGIGADGLEATLANVRNGLPITPTTDIADEITVTDSDASWDADVNWHTWSGTYQVPAGQTSTRIAFKASDDVADASIGNFIDNVVLTAAAGECPPEAQDSAALPNTGTNVTSVVLVGLVALLAGAGSLLAIRRRKA